MGPFHEKKTVSFEINGRRYGRIEDVPLEYREMVRLINENPAAFDAKTVKKTTTTASIDFSADPGERPGTADHREKFLRETVLPNLHLMDAKTQAEVLRALSGETGKRTSPWSTACWIILYAALGLLAMFGFSALKNMFLAP